MIAGKERSLSLDSPQSNDTVTINITRNSSKTIQYPNDSLTHSSFIINNKSEKRDYTTASWRLKPLPTVLWSSTTVHCNTF
mmetsp:Transcript_28716/g.50860  ORF Transcript_28716/g.50860 Transcript_28716/m.50860 type:complete len:81 (-) Transcript_28716:949-1191(-)